MPRWPMLVTLSLALPELGCADRIVAGLANAPSIQRTAPDDGVHDVVANGSDVCGTNLGRSPLRGHVPPCHAGSLPLAGATLVHVQSGTPEGESLVTPWLEHFYVGWPCARASKTTRNETVVLLAEQKASCAPP